MSHDVKTTDGASTLPTRFSAWVGSHPVLAGAAGGLIWGSVLRSWMRYITPFPEFTWTGTLTILIATSIAGISLGAAWSRSRRGTGDRWRWLGVGGLAAFGSAGIVMLPSVVLGALAIGRRRWPWAVRIGLVVFALGGQYVLFGVDEEQFPLGRFVPAMAWYTVMICIEMWAFSILFRPNRDRIG